MPDIPDFKIESVGEDGLRVSWRLSVVIPWDSVPDWVESAYKHVAEDGRLPLGSDA